MFTMLYFNDTATTEIYTYRHTLSQHDALPISNALADVLDQENALLDAQRIQDIPALQKEKTTLTGLYEARLSEANAVAGLLQTIEPGLRDQLRQASERFEATATRNALSLRAAMELTNRLVPTIAEAVARHKTGRAHVWTPVTHTNLVCRLL